MSKTSVAQPKGRSSRRRTPESGLPQLAARLPENFRSPAAVNDFIYSLVVEVTAGRVDSRRATVLGYLSQLAIQTYPHIERESRPPVPGRINWHAPFSFITHIPRPDYSKVPGAAAAPRNPNECVEITTGKASRTVIVEPPTPEEGSQP
jgi:hypothetical protein